MPQVKQRLQTIDKQIRVLCARQQAGQPDEVHLSGLSAASSSDCCAYEHSQCLWTAVSAPTAGHMQDLVVSMSGTSLVADIDGRKVAAQATSERIHQLYEWIGGTSCSLLGMSTLLTAHMCDHAL